MHKAQLNGKGYTDLMGSRMGSEFTPEGVYEDEHLVSQVDPIQVIRRRLWIILLMALTFVGLTFGFSYFQTPTYEASIKILVGQKRGNATPNDLGNELQGLQQLTATMVEAVDTRPVAQGVIQTLDLSVSPETFQRNLNAQQVADTQFIEVSYEDPNPQRAQRIANTIGEVFSEKVSEVSPSASAISATVWEQAIVPDSPVSPNPVRNALLALILGLMVGVGLAFLLDYLDDDWRSPEELEKVSGVPTFGVIPAYKIHKSKNGGN